MALDKKTRQELLSRKNVVSVGRGRKKTGGVDTGRPAVVVGVRKKVSPNLLRAKDLVPDRVGGVETDVVVVPEFRVIPPRATEAVPRDEDDPTGRFRPCPAGCSIGHYHITAGTLGAWVKKDGQWYILSNNHVLANQNEAEIGDLILQPGPYDGGLVGADTLATLAEFLELAIVEESDCPWAGAAAAIPNWLAKLLRRQTRLVPVRQAVGTNLADCALAGPVDISLVNPMILGIGTIEGETEFDVGDTVIKYGRTTHFTSGVVSQVEVATTVQMGTGRYALFEDQVMVEADGFSDGGDSGSAILSLDYLIGGLLFAGGNSMTLLNRYQNVKDALGLDSF